MQRASVASPSIRHKEVYAVVADYNKSRFFPTGRGKHARGTHDNDFPTFCGNFNFVASKVRSVRARACVRINLLMIGLCIETTQYFDITK